jgi:hypothetical protein
LEECGDPYSERKKVDTFVKGLVADRFQVVRASILKDAATRNDFQQAYAFVETMEGFSPTIDGGRDNFDRHVNAVGTDGAAAAGGGKLGWMSPADWYKLPEEQRKAIQSRRDKNKIKNKKQKGNPKTDTNPNPNSKTSNKKAAAAKRKLAELAADVIREYEDGGAAEQPVDKDKKPKSTPKNSDGGPPSDQFGRNVHAVVAFAKAVQQEMATEN